MPKEEESDKCLCGHARLYHGYDSDNNDEYDRCYSLPCGCQRFTVRKGYDPVLLKKQKEMR